MIANSRPALGHSQTLLKSGPGESELGSSPPSLGKFLTPRLHCVDSNGFPRSLDIMTPSLGVTSKFSG